MNNQKLRYRITYFLVYSDTGTNVFGKGSKLQTLSLENLNTDSYSTRLKMISYFCGEYLKGPQNILFCLEAQNNLKQNCLFDYTDQLTVRVPVQHMYVQCLYTPCSVRILCLTHMPIRLQGKRKKR